MTHGLQNGLELSTGGRHGLDDGDEIEEGKNILDTFVISRDECR